MNDSQRKAIAVLGFFVLALFARAPIASAEGNLFVRGDDGQVTAQFPLARTDVDAEVSGEVIAVTVTQHYTNPYPTRIEAVYTFPLPVDAAVDDLEMRIGRRVVRGVVRTRSDAQQVYSAARQEGQRAALLEEERPNVFTMSVANIDPGNEIEVRTRYSQIAHYDHATYEMVFPMVVGPRWIPGQPLVGPQSGSGARGDTDRVPDGSRVSPTYVAPGTRSGHTIGVRVRIDAGSPITRVDSAAHAISLTRETDSIASVALVDREEIPNRDFVLRWSLSAPVMKTAVFTHRAEGSADGYVGLMFEPQHDVPEGEIAAREIFFLVDTSGSMQGAPIAAAIAAIRRSLATLNATDTFQIINFADSASAFARAPLPNTPANVQRANEYLSHLDASGGTNQLVGIHAALSAPGDAMRLRYVVFMTDGYIGNEAEILRLVHNEIGSARIFGFGIGGSVNRFLLDEVAHAGRGVAEYLLPGEDPAAMIERFYLRIGRPHLTDIQIDWGGLNVQQMVPAQVPDLSTFEPLLVLARYAAAGSGTVTVRGRIAGRPFERRIALTLPATSARNAAISQLWARDTITELSRRTHFEGETTQLVDEITRVALTHNLVSRYTSLVAVDQLTDPNAPRSPAVRVLQPGEAPQGLNLAAAGGVIAGPAPIVPPIYVQRVPGTATFTSETVGGNLARPIATNPGSAGGSDVSARAVTTTIGHYGRGGCASCSVQTRASHGDWAFLLAAIGALFVIGRRRRK